MPFVDGYIQNTHTFRAYSFHQKVLPCLLWWGACHGKWGEKNGSASCALSSICFLHPVHHRKRNFLRLPFIPSDYPQRLITSALPLRSRETQLFFYVGLPYNFFFLQPELNLQLSLSGCDKSGISVSHSGLHSAITVSIQPTELSKQKNFSFSLSFSKAPFSVTLQPFDLCPNGAGHLGAEVQRWVKSGCVYMQERVCVCSLPVVCALHTAFALPGPWDPTCWVSPFPCNTSWKEKKKKLFSLFFPSSHQTLLSLLQLSWHGPVLPWKG